MLGAPEVDESSIDAPIARDRDGRYRITTRKDPAGQPARTRCRVVERGWIGKKSEGRPFAVIEAIPETGRTHQIRLHLAHVGLPVIGDALVWRPGRGLPASVPPCGGTDDPAPFDGQADQFSRAAAPAAWTGLSRACPNRLWASWRNSLRIRAGVGAGRPNSCGRWSGWPSRGARHLPPTQPLRFTGWSTGRATDCPVDGRPVRRRARCQPVRRRRDALPPKPIPDGLAAMLASATDVAHPCMSEYRPKQASRVPEDEMSSLAPPLPVYGPQLALRKPPMLRRHPGLVRSSAARRACNIEIRLRRRTEHADSFPICARAGRRVRAWAEGKTVLNTFAYTCGFGLAATAGGAARALNLDLSRHGLAWGQENYRLNGFAPDEHDFVFGDVFDWLARFARRGETFDLVILDPPSFSKTQDGPLLGGEGLRPAGRAGGEGGQPGRAASGVQQPGRAAVAGVSRARAGRDYSRGTHGGDRWGVPRALARLPHLGRIVPEDGAGAVELGRNERRSAAGRGMQLSPFLEQLQRSGYSGASMAVYSLTGSDSARAATRGANAEDEARWEPSYLALHRSGELRRRARAAMASLASCRLCPHECRREPS